MGASRRPRNQQGCGLRALGAPSHWRLFCPSEDNPEHEALVIDPGISEPLRTQLSVGVLKQQLH